MKNLFLIIALTLSLTSYAQAPFQGKITYDLAINNASTIEEQQKLPKEVVAFYKEGKMRFDIIASDFNFHIITNESNEEATFMMEIKGDFTMKMAFRTNKNRIKDEFDIDETPKIRSSRERKNIAGYTCKKLIIDNNDGEAYAYISEKLNAQNLNWLLDEDINGTLMEFTLRNREDNSGIILRAREVQKMNVSDTEFNIPSDYMVISEEGLKNMFGDKGLF